MDKIILQIIALVILVFMVVGIDLDTRPFHLRFTNPYLAVGFILIIIGIFLIYYQGNINAKHD